MEFLEGYRGVGAVLVVLYHWGVPLGNKYNILYANFGEYFDGWTYAGGLIAVQQFFFLTATVLSAAVYKSGKMEYL